MSLKIDPRIIFLYNRYIYAKFDLHKGIIAEEEFQQKVDLIEDECIEMFGTIDPFYNYLKLNLKENEPLTEKVPV